MKLTAFRAYEVAGNEEALLSDWTIVVFALTTTALLFFHMTQKKTVHIHKKASAAFACSLILIALIYNILSLLTFLKRTQSIIVSLDKGETSTYNTIRTSQISYGTLTFLVSIIQLGLVIVITDTSIPELKLSRYIPFLR